MAVIGAPHGPRMVAASFRPDHPDCASKECALSEIEPGMRVIQPERPDWGVGQVQSVVGDRVTVNFENAGKLLLNLAVIRLEPAEE